MDNMLNKYTCRGVPDIARFENGCGKVKNRNKNGTLFI